MFFKNLLEVSFFKKKMKNEEYFLLFCVAKAESAHRVSICKKWELPPNTQFQRLEISKSDYVQVQLTGEAMPTQ